MNIIIEGVDGIGKSTLVNGLANALNFAVIHNKANTNNTIDYYYKLQRVPSVIQDRSFISEKIYSEIFGRHEILSNENIDLLFTTDEDTENNKYIILYSSDSKIYIYNNKDETDLLKDKQIEINSMYREFAYEYDIKLFDIAKYQGMPEKLLEDVLEAIK